MNDEQEREMLTVTIDAEALQWLREAADSYSRVVQSYAILRTVGDRAREALKDALPEPSR